jgi:hypothetical protein
MHLLHRALESDERLRGVVSELSAGIAKNPLKQAILLDLNPYWRMAQRLEAAGLDERVLFDMAAIVDGGFLLPNFVSGGAPIDLNFRSDLAETLTGRLFGYERQQNDGPYLLRIYSRAAPIGKWEGDSGFYRQLVEQARACPIPTVVETHSEAQLIALPGQRVFSNGCSGTLGGFLRDEDSNVTYGVTCGHVAGPGEVLLSCGTWEECHFSAPPVPLLAGVACSQGCADMTSLDVALLSSGGSHMNVAKAVAGVVAPGDLVDMDGATSGSRRYEIGAAVVEHAIGGACWNRLYQIHAPTSNGLFPTALSVAMTPPPKGGDSGAWILRGQEWAGMVVAADALHGYALAASQIVSETNSRANMNLALP